MSVEVLKGLRFILSLSTLSDKSSIQISRFRISTSLTRIFYVIPMNCSLTFVILYSFDIGFNLEKVSGAISLIFGIIQMDLVFTTLAMKRLKMIDILDEFQSVVQRSKCRR